MESESNFLLALGLARLVGVQMSLKAAIELNVLNIIASSGPNTHLSAAQIVSKLSTTNPDAAATNLDRILRFLASNSLLSCKPSTTSNTYGLTNISRWFVAGEGAPSCASMILLACEKEIVESLYNLKDAVLEPDVTSSLFERVHGQNLYDFVSKKQGRINSLFNDSMANTSKIWLDLVLTKYHGFNNVDELMDVGGGDGTSLAKIVSLHPHIRGINLDLPHVVANAPIYSGVDHVGGDMFESLPNAKTILFKRVLHNWDDQKVMMLLRNSWEALPEDGKVIAVEFAIPEEIGNDKNEKTSNAIIDDFYMMVMLPGGKERTTKEYDHLAKAAGFAGTQMFPIAQEIYVMEFHKKC